VALDALRKILLKIMLLTSTAVSKERRARLNSTLPVLAFTGSALPLDTVSAQAWVCATALIPM
jgi:hypothetical protein